jgi:hypothetical protein
MLWPYNYKLERICRGISIVPHCNDSCEVPKKITSPFVSLYFSLK